MIESSGAVARVVRIEDTRHLRGNSEPAMEPEWDSK